MYCCLEFSRSWTDAGLGWAFCLLQATMAVVMLQLHLTGGWASVEDTKLHSYVWCLSALPRGLSMLTWLFILQLYGPSFLYIMETRFLSRENRRWLFCVRPGTHTVAILLCPVVRVNHKVSSNSRGEETNSISSWCAFKKGKNWCGHLWRQNPAYLCGWLRVPDWPSSCGNL